MKSSWGSQKNLIFRRVQEKPVYKGVCLKRGALTVSRFNVGLGKKEGVVFMRGIDTPMHTNDFK